MSQKDFMAQFDQGAHAAFAAAGMADHGQYTPKGGTAVSCDVFVDRSVQDVGDLGQARSSRTEVVYVLSSMTPTVPAAEGVLVVDGDTLTNVYEISNDGSLSRWLVRGG
ncbi:MULTISPECIES: hypothetical protein [unclassified Pseudoxanthomonas]|uniref:head-tail joining protein n=1 Tax=unclassified Pseudoxanthomonas TaxID=2645906 RepID=UPI00307F4465